MSPECCDVPQFPALCGIQREDKNKHQGHPNAMDERLTVNSSVSTRENLLFSISHFGNKPR